MVILTAITFPLLQIKVLPSLTHLQIPSIADVSGNSITAKGVGFATITASQAGDDIYLPIASFMIPITIYVSAKGVDLSDFPRFGLVEVSDSCLPCRL